MVYCPNCGTANRDDAAYCNECGGELRYDGQSKPQSQASYTNQPQYRQPTYRPPPSYIPTKQADEADSIAYLCSFCVPIVGVVLFFVWHQERPNTANTMLMLAIFGFVISFILGLLSG